MCMNDAMLHCLGQGASDKAFFNAGVKWDQVMV